MKAGYSTSAGVARPATTEASLDIQLLMSVGLGINTELYGVSGHSTDPPTTQPVSTVVAVRVVAMAVKMLMMAIMMMIIVIMMVMVTVVVVVVATKQQ